MPILRSPGCNCSCECLLVEQDDYNYALTANTLHEIPQTVPVNSTVDLSYLLPRAYFEDTSNVFKIHIKDSTGTTTHKTLTYQSQRDTTNFYNYFDEELFYPPQYLSTQPLGRHPSHREYENYYPNYRYDNRFNKRFLNVNDGTYDFECLVNYKNTFVGEKKFRIKSVTAGQFRVDEGNAFSIKETFGPGSSNATSCADAYDQPSRWTFEKLTYAILDTDTSVTSKLMRFDAHYDCSEGDIRSDVTVFPSTDTAVWTASDRSKTFTNSRPFEADKTYDIKLKFDTPNACYEKLGIPNARSSVFVIPTASETGDGFFHLETLEVVGFEGTSTPVRVYRTGGNSTAVDVVVAVGNSDVTLNFAAGDVYKDFTITHDTHDGQNFTSGMIPTNDILFPAFVLGDNFSVENLPLQLVFRRNTFEFGHRETFSDLTDDRTSPERGHQRPDEIKNAAGSEWWAQRVPFERDGWDNSTVKIYVESNVDTTLESFRVYEVKHEATCNLASDNIDCPENNRCDVIGEYHEQQFDIDYDFGLNATYMPAASHTFNDGCTSYHAFWNDPLNEQIASDRFGHYFASRYYDLDDWRLYGFFGPTALWNVAFNILQFNMDAAERTVRCYDDAHWDAQEQSVTINVSCGTVDDSTDFSNMPRACAAFGSIDYCFTHTCGDSYTNGSVVGYAYPVGDLPGYTPVWSGEYATTCHEIIECSGPGFNTDNGIHKTVISATAMRPDRHGFVGNDAAFQSPTDDYHRAGWRIAHYESPDEKYDNVWEWDSTSWFYVGQNKVHEVDYDITLADFTSSVDFLDDTTPDYWFNYTYGTNTSLHGYYRIRYQSGTNIRSGPFSTADDGLGNTFASVDDQVGIYTDVKVIYFTSWLNRPAGEDLDEQFDYPGLGQIHYLPEPGYTVVDGSLSAEFVGKFVLEENFYKDVEYAIGVSDDDKVSGIPHKIDGYYPTASADRSEVNSFDNGDGGASFPDQVYFSSCTPTVTTDFTLDIDPSFSGPPTGYTRKFVDDSNQPTTSVTTCTSETGGYSYICCDGNSPGSEVINSKHFVYDSLSDWNGEITGDGTGFKESRVNFYTTGAVGGSLAERAGITSLLLREADYQFPCKWGDCWTEQDQRTESFDGSTDTVIGPDKIYPFRSIDAPAGPTFQQLNGTAEDDPWSLCLDVTAQSNVISKSNITITARAYATQWQKH